jgi:two-component system, LytTR family, response regulator
MPGLKGFEVPRSIPSAIDIPLVIFTTGYDQHALAAFEANALAYLLKPIEPERLSFAIERLRLWTSLIVLVSGMPCGRSPTTRMP